MNIKLTDKSGVLTPYDSKLTEKVCAILEKEWDYDMHDLKGDQREYTIAVIEATKEALSHEH
jgi:K+/H+ antiporter YhaU regulatory subunit KhtT